MVLRAQWPLGTIAQFFHFVAEEKKRRQKNKGILWLGYHRYPSKNSSVTSWNENLATVSHNNLIQGFPALRKVVTTHVKKNIVFFHVCWYSRSAAYTSLTFGATRSGWWMNGKAFTIFNTSCLLEFSRIMAAKTLKNPYRWQTMRFKLS